jgi:hypothetical protein
VNVTAEEATVCRTHGINGAHLDYCVRCEGKVTTVEMVPLRELGALYRDLLAMTSTLRRIADGDENPAALAASMIADRDLVTADRDSDPEQVVRARLGAILAPYGNQDVPSRMEAEAALDRMLDH